MFRWGPDDVVRVIAGEYDISRHRTWHGDWEELMATLAGLAETSGREIAQLLRQRAQAIVARPVPPADFDAMDAVMALLQDLDLGQGDAWAASLLGLAEVFEHDGPAIARSLEAQIRDARWASGRCPECGGPLDEDRWNEGFRPLEGRVCAACGVVFRRD
ncbi:MAG: hypothetical protein DIU69_07255 [Bacillota bacterium]|nr:MAG: hypothetical protein DIU69_07255 [Bacillota bacterium]